MLKKINYVKPYPQAELNGELGLTAGEIAASLGVPPGNVRKKIKRNIDFLNGDLFHTFQMERTNDNGKIYYDYILNVVSAKYMVATWKNNLGRKYFNYLIECEKIIENELPRMKALIEAFQNKFLKPKKSKNNKHVLCTTVQEKRDMFGNPYFEFLQIRKSINDMNPKELEEYKFNHRQKTMKGIMDKQNESLDNKKIIPMATYRQLKK